LRIFLQYVAQNAYHKTDVITQYRALKGSEKQCIALMIKTLLEK